MNSETAPPSSAGSPSRQRTRQGIIGIALCGLALCLIVMSCSTTQTMMVIPPAVPGATYVGSDKCAECHEELTRWFKTASHARLMAPGTNSVQAGCESCHGAGSVHVKVGGGPKTIINPNKSPETCFQCHLDKRAEFNLPYHHPVLEGKITCVNCHEPHKWDATRAGGTELLTERDLCAECHIAQRGPFVFEHEATREGCSSCHNVHGSVNAKLLQQRNANLCFKCHFQRQVQTDFGRDILIGERGHANFLTRGTCWSGGCHEAVHGSQVSPSLRF